MGERSFARTGGGVGQPRFQVFLDANPAFVIERKRFPGADGGEPEFVFLVLERMQDAPPESPRILKIPQPDVCVKQQSQSRRTSHSSSSVAGETMSPVILIEFFIDPIQALRSSTAVGGTTSATGLPKRVMRMGFLVERTRSITARHLALNSEMAISCTASLCGHSNTLWSYGLTIVC